MGTTLMLIGTVGLALLTLFAIAVMLHIVARVLPHDPPIGPPEAVDRLGAMVDDQTRARLLERMRSAR